MARARNIKPSFFTNDELSEIDPLGRLLFMGLWTIADFKGDIIWRERRIKAQILPYDNCDIKKLSIKLDRLGFIRFYSDGESIYLNITNFSKHQNPHKNERDKGSDIPEYSEDMRQAVDLKGITINPDKSRLNLDENGTTPADSLIPYPDSFNLNPDSLIPKTLTPKSSEQDLGELSKRIFNHWQLIMNKGDRVSFTAERKKAVVARLKSGYSVEDIFLAIDNCAKSEFHMGGNDEGKVWDDLTLICRNDTKLEGFRDRPVINKSDLKMSRINQDIEDFANGGNHG